MKLSTVVLVGLMVNSCSAVKGHTVLPANSPLQKSVVPEVAVTIVGLRGGTSEKAFKIHLCDDAVPPA